MLFFGKKKPEPISYNPEEREPAIRRSICTGEMTAGFIDRSTGKFQDLMLLENQKAVTEFAERTGVAPDELKTVY